jgi:diguanylate cyclase (GGDEF)-like protein
MRKSLSKFVQATLERYLSHGSDSASREDALMIRRARGFGLIGFAVVFLGAFVAGIIHGVTELMLASLGLMFFIVLGLWLGYVRESRYIRPVTQASMGAIVAGIFVTGIAIDDAAEVSVVFPMLIVLVITYVLGARSAFFWTLAITAGSAYAVTMMDMPAASSPSDITVSGLIATRAVAIFATFGFAVAERRVAERQSLELEFLAGHDSLTGLLNRRAFEERLAPALARARRHERRLALIMIDLDGFKRVNDIHGHAVGDELLRRLARRIDKLTRETDAVCRLGGDEFLVLVEDVQEKKHIQLHAQRLLDTLMRPVEIGGTTIQVGASVGISVQTCVEDDAERLMRSADKAMYEAKSAGGGTIRNGTLDAQEPLLSRDSDVLTL